MADASEVADEAAATDGSSALDAGARARPLQERLLGGMRVVLLVAALTVQFGMCVWQLAMSYRDYTSPPREVIAFVLFLIIAVVGGGAVVRKRTIAGPWRWAGACLALAADALATSAVRPEDYLTPAHWSFGLVGWYGLFLLFDLAPAWVPGFLATHVAVTAAGLAVPVLTAQRSLPDHRALAVMGATATGVYGFQLAVGFAAQALRRVARAASEAAAEEEQVRTEEAITEQLHRDHQRRYAGLLETTVPLLAELASGRADPRDAEVRQRCTREATRMRRLFAENDEVSDRLVHELQAAIDIAERQGVTAQLAVRGAPCPLPAGARRALLDPVSGVLATARTAARATVVRVPHRVRVSVIADAVGCAVPSADTADVQVTTLIEGEQLWVETEWQPTE